LDDDIGEDDGLKDVKGRKEARGSWSFGLKNYKKREKMEE
jgi:hypothetical protein